MNLVVLQASIGKAMINLSSLNRSDTRSLRNSRYVLILQRSCKLAADTRVILQTVQQQGTAAPADIPVPAMEQLLLVDPLRPEEHDVPTEAFTDVRLNYEDSFFPIHRSPAASTSLYHIPSNSVHPTNNTQRGKVFQDYSGVRAR